MSHDRVLSGPERAVALRDEGRNPDAELELKTWLAAHPRDAEALALLVQVQLNQGKVAAAEAAWATLAEAAPHAGPTARARAQLLLRKGRAQEAVAAAREALAAEPDRPETALLLATALATAGSALEALTLIDRVIARAPRLAAAHVARAQALARSGRPAEIAAALETALTLKPQMPLWAFLGAARLAAGEAEGAAEAYAKSLAIRPDDPPTLAALAQLRHGAKRHEEARSLYERALALEPGLVSARLGLATLLLEQNDLAGARTMFDQALAQAPSLLTFLKARLLLPGVAASDAEIEALRIAYAEALEAAAGMAGEIGAADAAAFPGWFYLGYHGQNDRPILQALDRLLAAKAPALSWAAPHLPGWRPPAGHGRRIRVGFVSQFFYGHTNARLHAGLIAHLDRRRFEVVVAHMPGGVEDAMRAAVGTAADRAIRLPNDLAGQRAALAAEALDVAFFTDIGMAVPTYFLARSRVAPVQVTSWGYPDTSGLTSIDYFMSSELIEPQDGQDAYSERLIRLPRLPCFYEGLPVDRQVGRAALGLPEEGVLYGCLQSLFKIHPQFDAVLADIADADPQARLVFIDSNPAFSQALRERWAKFAGLNERVLFLPRVRVREFEDLTGAMDVLLDPPHFGSGATLYEAAGLGRAIVTWPGRFARGRIVAGAYAQMGIADAPVAGSLAGYAALAVDLANDRPRRRALGARIREGAERELYADRRALQAIESFFEAAVDAAGRGEKLPSGWRTP